MREHVVAASKEMSKGNWRECADFVLAVKVKMRMLYSQAASKWLVVRAGARTLIGGGGGVYSYIQVLPDLLLLKTTLFQKKLVGHDLNI